MNKKGFWKVLMVSLVMASAIGLLASGAIAQNIPLQFQLQDGLGQEMGQNGITNGTILLDNFQYWKSPRDMGWRPIEPTYPIYGAGLGLGLMETVVDFQEGSRVLDVYSNPSVFLPMANNPTNPYMPYTIVKKADYRDTLSVKHEGIPGNFSILNFKVRAPLAVELFDTFRVIVRVRTTTNGAGAGLATPDVDLGNVGAPGAAAPACGVTFGTFGIADIVLMPRDQQVGCATPGLLTAAGSFAPSIVAVADEYNVYSANGTVRQGVTIPQINVAIGREFADGSWHLVTQNLNPIIAAVSGTATETIAEVISVTVRGNQYRLDDVSFTDPLFDLATNQAPYLFRIGPVYGQLFNITQSRLIYAEDADLYWLYTAAALTEKGIVNAGLGSNLPCVVDLTSGAPVADGAAGFVPEHGQFFDIARGVPVAAYPAQMKSLSFVATVGDALGPMANNLCSPIPLPVQAPGVDNNADGYIDMLDITVPAGTADANADGVVDIRDTTVMASFMASDVIQALDIPVMDADFGARVANNGAGAVAGNPMYVYVCALINSGYTTIPNVRILRPAGGQVLEDMIVTVRVQDGIGVEDTETFPISVVNYPVTNQPPLIEQLEDQFFQVGASQQVCRYQITASDPDWPDKGTLTYRATLNGIPSYQYGPWINSIINPITGLVSFAPQFEGSMTCIVTVTDARGAQAVGHFNIFCVNPGTWLNHPPIVRQIIESPQTVTAGQLFTISDLNIADPDGQVLYYSCNIGAVGRNGIFTFQSEFPGEYLVQITAYDILGGAVTQQFVLQVLPWWSI